MSDSIVTTEATLVSGVFALPDKGIAVEAPLSDVAHEDLKWRTAHGAVVSLVAQAATFVLRIVSMMVLARLLVPKDFGLVGMVTAFTGFLGLFRDAGLSMATVQRASITHAQISTLFWINLGVGWLLAGLGVLAAPVLAWFYSEPRLFWVTIALGSSFIFNGAGAQHRAILQRRMRFVALALIDSLSLVLGIGVAVAMALAGEGYWALVMSNVTPPAVGVLGVWLAARWIPGKPRRGAGVGSLLWFGGTVTLNAVIAYLAYNIDKILLGRFYGAEALGLYGRAYQLTNLPTENLTATIGVVAFPALARVQNEPSRLRTYFLKGYSSFLSLVVPITVACALFSEDIIRVFLGAKWQATAPIFRLLAPTILGFALINPLSWLMMGTGQVKRSLKIALVIAPLVVLGYVFGLPYGPRGVAMGFSASMAISVAPLAFWAKRGTLITMADLLVAIMRPGLSAAIAAAATLAGRNLLGLVQPVLLRLVLETALMSVVYLAMLLFVFKQKAVFVQLLRETRLWPNRGNDKRDQSE
jgi:PST family polysaccharide transporter